MLAIIHVMAICFSFALISVIVGFIYIDFFDTSKSFKEIEENIYYLLCKLGGYDEE